MIGYVYKIQIHDKVYIGSTTDLEKREEYHNIDLNEKIKNTKLYIYCRENNITQIKLIILDKSGYDNRNDLLWLERLYIEKYNSIENGLNMVLPIYSIEERNNIKKITRTKTMKKQLKWTSFYDKFLFVYKNRVLNRTLCI
jgi:hypothetical protein